MEKCCCRKMKIEKYVLTYTAKFAHREVYKFFCLHCGNVRLIKRFIDKRGQVLETAIRGRKAAIREFEDLQTQIMCVIQKTGKWSNAKGYRYFKGYKHKKGKKGGIYRLSDEGRDSEYKVRDNDKE